MDVANRRGEAFVDECSVNWLQLCDENPHSFGTGEATSKYKQLTYSCIWMSSGVLEYYSRLYSMS